MSTLNVNTINETTASSGVTVDGVLVKDSTVDNAYVPNAITTLATEVASTSGTSIDFTGIPSGVKKITIMFEGASTTGSSPPMIQIGDSGGIEASGYTGCGGQQDGNPGYSSNSTGFEMTENWGTGQSVSGIWILSLKDATNNTWMSLHQLARIDIAMVHAGGGAKSLSAELTTVRLTTIGGSDTFDAGSINIQYSF